MSGDQTDLFEAAAHARRTDPGTSHEAAASVEHIRQRQAAVLTVFKKRGGKLTLEQLVTCYDGPKQSDSGIRTRASELVTKGLLRDSGAKVKTKAGRNAIVWEVV